mmetsp:Transcript_27734/g.65896  ORF Transcript_27734/g.65896 Transcript_27734/m.65896 type:complete len:256 (+) Transcript_27734:382-1149(+)
MSLSIKICLVGPAQTGKTFLAKVLAEQSIADEPEYNPTAGVRVQELTRNIKNERVKVQLWDCAGGPQHQPYWPTLAKGLDGLLMVFDPAQPGHESELEKLYTSFAQPSRLTTSQCMTLGVTLRPGSGGAGAAPAALQGPGGMFPSPTDLTDRSGQSHSPCHEALSPPSDPGRPQLSVRWARSNSGCWSPATLLGNSFVFFSVAGPALGWPLPGNAGWRPEGALVCHQGCRGSCRSCRASRWSSGWRTSAAPRTKA